MKEIVKEHPLRPIILRFDFDKPQLEFERKGLESHYQMHDLTWEMFQNFKQHYLALREIDLKISELDYLLLPIEQDLDILEVFLKIKDPSVLPFDEKDGEVDISIDLQTFYQGVHNHNLKLNDLHSLVTHEHDWFKAHFDMIYEKESWIDTSLWDDIHKIYRNYLDAQVDIVTLDRDQEEFRETLSEVFDYQDMYGDFGETIFEAYANLNKRSDLNYRRTEVVNEGLSKLGDKE